MSAHADHSTGPPAQQHSSACLEMLLCGLHLCTAKVEECRPPQDCFGLAMFGLCKVSCYVHESQLFVMHKYSPLQQAAAHTLCQGQQQHQQCVLLMYVILHTQTVKITTRQADMPWEGGVRSLLQAYPSCSVQLLQQSLGGMDGGVKQGVWLLPHPVQVIPPQIAPVVAKGHTIWVKHWHYLYDCISFRIC